MNRYQRMWDVMGYGRRWVRLMAAAVRALPGASPEVQARYATSRRQGAAARVWARMERMAS